MEKVEFFISYSRVDRPWAEWAAWVLEEAGYRTVLQAWDFRPGKNWVLQMQAATSSADRTLAILSPDFLASECTQPEWAAAFARDPQGRDPRLLPVRVRECQPTGLLGQIVFIDLVALDERAAKANLLRGVGRDRLKPQAPVPFPDDAASAAVKPLYPGSAAVSPLEGTGRSSAPEVFEEVYQFARTEMHKSAYGAELYARSWMEQFPGNDFGLFRGWFLFARCEMMKTDYSAELFAKEMMRKHIASMKGHVHRRLT